MRSLFSLARKLSPVVIFLDEIDALFGSRMSSREAGGAHRGLLTEFMQVSGQAPEMVFLYLIDISGNGRLERGI